MDTVVAVVSNVDRIVRPEALLDFQTPLLILRRLRLWLGKRYIGFGCSRASSGIESIQESCLCTRRAVKQIRSRALIRRQKAGASGPRCSGVGRKDCKGIKKRCVLR